MNGHFSHLPRLNYWCKIECLHLDQVELLNSEVQEEDWQDPYL